MKKKILITGGTGFLGRNLGRCLQDEYTVILTGRNNKQNLLAQQQTGCRIVPMDVCSIESVRDAFVEIEPEIVIHAAATKFVDLAERFPMECVDVNVLGSQNIARVAMQMGIETVVGISTDKASPPVRNTYGLSKALMERMYSSLNEKTKTCFTTVRYGNVVWSTGSVFTIWKRMHSETGVIESTGPDMRRFFFTVNEAVTLVKTAISNIEIVQGKVLSRKMKAAKIRDLLNVWIQDKGGSWCQIEGRPGERDDEYLIGDIELPYTQEISLGKVSHYLISFNEKVASPLVEGLSSANTDKLSEAEMLDLINGQVE